MGGGIGRIFTTFGSAVVAGLSPGNSVGNSTWLVFGRNTVFTRQFRGYASYTETTPYPARDAGNPFRLTFSSGGVFYSAPVYRVWNDTLLEVEAILNPPAIANASAVPFSLGTPLGSGALAFGDLSEEVILPGSGAKEQLTVVCVTSAGARVSNASAAGACKFAKELKAGYLLVANFSGGAPVVRVITSVVSDVELTVDADFLQSAVLLGGVLPWSGATAGAAGWSVAAAGAWTYVACPPRVGKRANGAGNIESSWQQGAWSSAALTSAAEATAAAALAVDSYTVTAGNLLTASGGATGSAHRIVGRGTRFASQFGASTVWAAAASGGYFNQGPYVSVQINGDWETQKVSSLGASAGGYNEYFAILENSFSEPLLKLTPFVWYTMLTPGTGRVRSYGKRLVSEEWAAIEPWNGTSPAPPGAQYSTSGYAGKSRFLTQLRTGFSITACGQTRTVNSIQSDVELTVDRPFSNGNREFFPGANSTAGAYSLSVRGLSRSLPLWPRGVTVQVLVVLPGTAATARFKYNVWWKTFMRTDDGDGDALDDGCPGYVVGAAGSVLGTNTTACSALSMTTSSWFNLQDNGLAQALNVYLKWSSSANFVAGDEWRLHVGDIANCPWLISREGERYMHDDNANPPVCYNHGKCLPISSAAQTSADAAMRPAAQGLGLLVSSASGTVTSTAANSQQSSFLQTLGAGDIVRMVSPTVTNATDEGQYLDMRVSQVLSNTSFLTDSLVTFSGRNYSILKCAAGRRYDSSTGVHDLTASPSATAAGTSRGLVGDSNPGAYLPHPELGFYQTWSYKYCEVDPGCCGFRVASVVSPQAFAYYTVKPDHGNYNLRVATFTVNDNLDMYTRRDDRGRPDMTSYDSTSVRESVPWAIDQDQSTFACAAGNLGLGVAALGVATSAAAPTTLSLTSNSSSAYASALGAPSVSATSPACTAWTLGIMGDNKYPQTVGASEYSAQVALEFNFEGFACADSVAGEDATGLTGDPSHRTRCIESGLRFVRDADAVASQAAGNDTAWVVRLTESMRRAGSSFVPWSATTGPSYPMAQRSGALWWNRKVHLQDGFESNFVFQVTDPTQCGGADKICDGADGFAFVITNDARQETASSRSNDGWDCYPAAAGTSGDTGRNGCDPNTFTSSAAYGATLPSGLIGCPADGLGYGNSKKSSTVNYFGAWQECQLGLRKSLAVEFDLFYNVERRDPKQGIQHWWINATEYISYNDNHLGVFSTTEPFYASQPWGASQSMLLALHSDDENGAHYGSTPSVPTLADFQPHNVKVRYTRGWTTERQGSGQVLTSSVSSADGDRRLLVGDANTRFRSELRTGFEFGYADRVKANVKVKLLRDATNASAQAASVAGALFADDGVAVRVTQVLDDFNAYLEETSLAGATSAEQQARVVLQPAFKPSQATLSDYWIIKEYPGEIQVFIDDMDRYAFQVAVEDRDLAKILDGDGNAYIGFTASTGSRGFSLAGYDPEEVHQTHDLLAWNFCNRPGCVPY